MVCWIFTIFPLFLLAFNFHVPIYGLADIYAWSGWLYNTSKAKVGIDPSDWLGQPM
jgi:hypothetical protein